MELLVMYTIGFRRAECYIAKGVEEMQGMMVEFL